MMCLKSAYSQCFVRVEGAIINHYAGDFEIYICSKEVRIQKSDNIGKMKGREEKSRREEEKELEKNRYGCTRFLASRKILYFYQ